MDEDQVVRIVGVVWVQGLAFVGNIHSHHSHHRVRPLHTSYAANANVASVSIHSAYNIAGLALYNVSRRRIPASRARSWSGTPRFNELRQVHTWRRSFVPIASCLCSKSRPAALHLWRRCQVEASPATRYCKPAPNLHRYKRSGAKQARRDPAERRDDRPKGA